MAKKQITIAGLGIKTIGSLAAGIVLYFIIIAKFPKAAVAIRGTQAVVTTAASTTI